MLSKLHVTCLVIKEQIGQLSHCLRGLFSITAVKEESRYLLLRICRLGYMGQKAKKKKKIFAEHEKHKRRSCAILWPVSERNGRRLLCLLNDQCFRIISRATREKELGTHSWGRLNSLKRLNTHAEKTSKFSCLTAMGVRETAEGEFFNVKKKPDTR